MFFHEIAGELKTYMAPTSRSGDFVVSLIGDTLREPMTIEEQKMDKNDTFNPLSSDISMNMLEKIFEGKKFTVHGLFFIKPLPDIDVSLRIVVIIYVILKFF